MENIIGGIAKKYDRQQIIRCKFSSISLRGKKSTPSKHFLRHTAAV